LLGHNSTKGDVPAYQKSVKMARRKSEKESIGRTPGCLKLKPGLVEKCLKDGKGKGTGGGYSTGIGRERLYYRGRNCPNHHKLGDKNSK